MCRRGSAVVRVAAAGWWWGISFTSSSTLLGHNSPSHQGPFPSGLSPTLSNPPFSSQHPSAPLSSLARDQLKPPHPQLSHSSTHCTYLQFASNWSLDEFICLSLQLAISPCNTHTQNTVVSIQEKSKPHTICLQQKY